MSMIYTRKIYVGDVCVMYGGRTPWSRPKIRPIVAVSRSHYE